MMVEKIVPYFRRTMCKIESGIYKRTPKENLVKKVVEFLIVFFSFSKPTCITTPGNEKSLSKIDLMTKLMKNREDLRSIRKTYISYFTLSDSAHFRRLYGNYTKNQFQK